MRKPLQAGFNYYVHSPERFVTYLLDEVMWEAEFQVELQNAVEFFLRVNVVS